MKYEVFFERDYEKGYDVFSNILGNRSRAICYYNPVHTCRDGYPPSSMKTSFFALRLAISKKNLFQKVIVPILNERAADVQKTDIFHG
jgi:hypothetical protein